MPSNERKSSKDNQRVKSQNKDQKPGMQGLGSVNPAQNFVQVPLPNPQQVQTLLAITDIQEKKQCVGNMIYPCIQQAYGNDFVGKITGMLLDEKVVNLDLLVSDQKYLSQIAGQAKNMLEAQQKQQQ